MSAAGTVMLSSAYSQRAGVQPAKGTMAEIRAAHRAGPMVGDVIQAIDWTNGEDTEVGYEPDEYVAEPRWDPVTGYGVSAETAVADPEDDDDEPVVAAVKRGPGRPRKVQ